MPSATIAAPRHSGTAAQPVLADVSCAIAEDVETFRDIMRRTGLGAALPDVDFDALIERADSQSGRLNPWRVTAGKAAFQASS